MSYRVVEALRALGHDVLTAQEAGQANQRVADQVVLAFAISLNRAVLTFNRRLFGRLHRLQPQHAGIIGCTRDDNGPALAARVNQAISAHQPLTGKFIQVYRPSKP